MTLGDCRVKAPRPQAEVKRRGKTSPAMGTPRQPARALGTFQGLSTPLPTARPYAYRSPRPLASPGRIWKESKFEGGGARPKICKPKSRTLAAESSRPRTGRGPQAPPPALRAPHLQSGDVLVVELVLAVAQYQRRLPHATFPQQHHLEGIGSARRRPAAGRSHPVASRPPAP